MSRRQVFAAGAIAVTAGILIVIGFDHWFPRLLAMLIVAGTGLLLGMAEGERKPEPRGKKVPMLVMYPTGTQNTMGNPHWCTIRYEDVPESVIREVRSRLDIYDVDYY